MAKKYLSILLAITFIVCIFSACSAKQTQEETTVVTETTTKLLTDDNSFKLSYSQSDSLNPFESKALNNQVLSTLIFDSLFNVDENFDAVPSIATSYAYKDAKTLTVSIKSGVTFSDKTVLTAKDVVYSFNEAKSSPQWKNSLKGISSASATSDSEISFTLSYANPSAQNLLTFAIAKDGNDEKGYPIGTGRYKYDDGNGKVFLVVNKLYRDFNPRFTKVNLVNISSRESVDNAINISNISYAFRDLSEGANARLECNKKAVNINNLVYLGINSKSGITNNSYIRKAISLAIDRDTLVKSSFQGYAKSAESVFNPVSKLGQSTAVFSKTADVSSAKQAIAQSGYDSKKLTLTILTDKNSMKMSAAELIKQQLETVGFKVNITSLNSKSYKSYLKNSYYDIYLGETKLPNDMNLNCFFTKGGATNYGFDTSKSNCAKAYQEYLTGESEIGKFMIKFTEELPFIPLVYRQGMICYSKSMHGDMQGYYQNYFSNIENWYYNS